MEPKETTLKNYLQKENQELATILKDLGECFIKIQELIEQYPSQLSKQDQKSNIEPLEDQINAFILKFFTEEKQNIVGITTQKSPHIQVVNKNSTYILAIQGVDGVSNIETNLAIGTIFSVFKAVPNKKLKQSFYSSENLVLSGYALYSNALYYTWAINQVNMFLFDEDLNDYILIKENVKTPEQGDTYSINECYQNYWYPTVSEYIHELKSEHSYDMRYTGTLTADFHRILQYGGVYLYPSDKKQKTGKLKIIYQCIPLAYLMQKAGGKSINNSLQQDILTQKIDDISARTGFIIGSAFEIDTYMEISHKEQQADQQNDQEQQQQLISSLKKE